MKNGRVFGKFCRVSNHAVRKTRTERENEVALRYRHVARPRAVHSDHPSAKRIVGRKNVAPHKAFRNRNLRFLCKFKKFRFRARNFYATARVNNRAKRIIDDFCRVFDFFVAWNSNVHNALKICVLLNES